MCGRFTLRGSGEAVAEAFGLAEAPHLLPRFNIAPGQPVAVVRQKQQAQGRELAFLRWGLVPAWADDPSSGHRLANARSETAATKPSFRRAFRSRRCLVVTDGFYEWQREALPALSGIGEGPGDGELARWLPDAWQQRQRQCIVAPGATQVTGEPD
jgi:putative SOS response-associated peptidase YedK